MLVVPAGTVVCTFVVPGGSAYWVDGVAVIVNAVNGCEPVTEGDTHSTSSCPPAADVTRRPEGGFGFSIDAGRTDDLAGATSRRQTMR